MKSLLSGVLICSALLLQAAFAQESVAAPEKPDDHKSYDKKPGYMIVIGIGVDPAGMAEYAAAAVPLLIKTGGKLLFVTEEGQTEVIEGESFPGSIRVLEFPSLQAARDFYYSDEYQAAISLREGNGELQVMLADGWVPDPKWFRK